MASVSLDKVSKSWGSFTAVRDLDLDVVDGEFLVLLGASGCGKTTTMRLIAGLESVSAGDVLIDGVSTRDQLPGARDIAMVFQNYGLYPHMSVEDNIAYPLRLRNVPGAERAARVRAAAEKVHLDALLERKPRALSGGQRQRVALARAIVRTPRLFLMDEPLSNLDAKLRVSMRAELKRLHHDLATTTVYVTHDQIEAMTLATRVAVMNAGRIVQLAPPETIYNDPNSVFVASFIGSPPMNIVAGTAASGQFTFDGVTLEGVPEHLGGSIILGVRPGHLGLTAPGEGDLSGIVHAVEYLGDSQLAHVMVGKQTLTVLGDTHYKLDFDQAVGIRVTHAQCFYFDAQTQTRIRG